MALTTQQLISLGFKPSKRSSLYAKKYDTLVYPLNDTDFVYTGYNQFSNKINNKILWKSFKQKDSGERITYPVIHLGDTGFYELRSFLERSKNTEAITTEVRDVVEVAAEPSEIDAAVNTAISDADNG